jgi:hypothetical protein
MKELMVGMLFSPSESHFGMVSSEISTLLSPLLRLTPSLELSNQRATTSSDQGPADTEILFLLHLGGGK